MVRLRGLTWDHPRGLSPLVAAARRWTQLHSDVDVVWESRSLRAFGEGSLEEVAERYDLIVIDHPVVGTAVELGLLEPFRTHEAEPSCGAVGPSFRSYTYNDAQWALPIDASAQVSAYRPDLLEAEPPSTWDEVLELAATGRVAIPLTPMDALSSFFTLSAAASGSGGGILEDRDADIAAAGELLALCRSIDPASFERSPIKTLDAAGSGDGIAFIPLTFAYSNYSRPGSVPNLLAFGDIPCGGAGGATLGGAGIAVSSSSDVKLESAEFARWVAASEQQRTIVVDNDGQPASRAAWEDRHANDITNGFFRSLLPTLERASVRPNGPGFARFQTEAGRSLHAALREQRPPERTVDRIVELYERYTGSSSG